MCVHVEIIIDKPKYCNVCVLYYIYKLSKVACSNNAVHHPWTMVTIIMLFFDYATYAFVSSEYNTK